MSEESRPGNARKLSKNEEVLLVATACSKAPAGFAGWTLNLLAGRMLELTEHADLSRETIRRRLPNRRWSATAGRDTMFGRPIANS